MNHLFFKKINLVLRLTVGHAVHEALTLLQQLGGDSLCRFRIEALGLDDQHASIVIKLNAHPGQEIAMKVLYWQVLRRHARQEIVFRIAVMGTQIQAGIEFSEQLD